MSVKRPIKINMVVLDPKILGITTSIPKYFTGKGRGWRQQKHYRSEKETLHNLNKIIRR